MTKADHHAASYGSLARFKDIQRLHPLGKHTVLAAAGDMSDFQYLQKKLNALVYANSSLPKSSEADRIADEKKKRSL